jgi:uncharacterized membrane protein (DUF485 family)
MKTPSRAERYNARLGLVLFVGYSLFYLAFTLVNAFEPELAQRRLLSGINLTTWWGLGLIISAFILALLYGLLCRHEESSSANKSEDTTR